MATLLASRRVSRSTSYFRASFRCYASSFREERDTFGPIQVPSDKLYLLPLCFVVGASAIGYSYGPNPNRNINISKDKFFPGVFSVQGTVYCKSASEVTPLKGSVVRITCLGLDKYGYETAPFSILSRPTDGNGYFLAKLSAKLLEADGVRILQCKSFVHSSPLKACSQATDVNGGLSGAPLSAYRTLGSSNMRLYSLGPFVYTPSRY